MTEDRIITQPSAKKMRESLQADCSNCFGLCCTALNLVASSDFAINKEAGTPCPNLKSDYSCQIHSNLREKGFKGCTVFDCLGAGQMVSQVTFGGIDWRENPKIAERMFRVFPVMEQLYEMIAYIAEALSYKLSHSLSDKLKLQLDQLQRVTRLDADELLSLDIMTYREPVNELLLKTSEHIRKEFHGQNYRGIDWIGKNVKGKDLRGSDFRGAYLIATNLQHTDLRDSDFIGADLRDADLSGANLSTSMFLTQMQINSAKGNKETRLPSYLKRPAYWVD